MTICSFAGSVATPSLLTMCPKYLTSVWPKVHFCSYNFNPASLDQIAALVQYSRKYNIDGLVQYSRKCIFGTALTTFSFFNYSLVNYFRQVKSISCGYFHLSIYIIISLFTFYMKNSNGGHKTRKMTEMHLRLYCTNPDRSHLRLYCTNPAIYIHVMPHKTTNSESFQNEIFVNNE